MRLVVNGRQVEVEVPVETTLAELLRDRLGLMGTKVGCGKGECGACTVLVDGEAVCACLVLCCSLDGRSVTTIEGLAGTDGLHAIQQAFLDAGAVQCGFCTPGMIMSAKALLDVCPRPSPAHIKEALAGNLCRCTGYVKVVEAVTLAADRLAAARDRRAG